MSRKADMYRELGCNLRTECKQVKVICKGVIFPENFWMEQLVVTHFVTINRVVGKRITGGQFPTTD